MDGALGSGSLGHILALPLVSEEVLYALLASLAMALNVVEWIQC